MLQYFLITLCLFNFVTGDTSANCTYQDAIGTWQLFTGDFTFNCSTSVMSSTKQLTLQYPNIVEDEFHNIGTWTLIYNQGWEAVMTNVKYFGFFDYMTINSTHTVSLCRNLRPSWFHDVLVRQWRCFTATKLSTHTTINDASSAERPIFSYTHSLLATIMYGSQRDIVENINRRNLGWTAHDYTELHQQSLYNIVNMAGGSRNKLQRPNSAPVTNEVTHRVQFLPRSFDWRNVSGVNYVSPVRHQWDCGSCYSFASTGLLEARFRIRSNNSISTILSPQDIIDCNPYSQGCDGGLMFLTAGKYAEDFGLASDSCNPYRGVNGECSTAQPCKRFFATKYRYIGDFYGGCNEPLMRLELVSNGPVAVGYEVHHDFISYRSGVYHHDVISRRLAVSRLGFNPFEMGNHAVLIVGYGETAAGEKYWTVKNSWGQEWGEAGFFRIRRGNDECGIESIALVSDPIL